MARRGVKVKVDKSNQVRPAHVRGMGDVLFKGFQCLSPRCREFVFVREDEVSEFFEVQCATCQTVHKYGNESKFYDYTLRETTSDSVLRTGAFTILHDDYVAEAQQFKYCIICYTLKPIGLFDKHSARKSKRQGECRLCKGVYNALKNPTRTPDQHREAAQKRRLYMDLTVGENIDSEIIYKRFQYRCFKCGKNVRSDLQIKSDSQRGNLDHTLPAKFLWPLTSHNATLLCQEHNGAKADKWPSEFYSDAELKRLVTLTGFAYSDMTRQPFFNPDALQRLQDPEFVDALLEKHARHMNEIVAIRNRILDATKLDFFSVSQSVSEDWIRTADERRKN